MSCCYIWRRHVLQQAAATATLGGGCCYRWWPRQLLQAAMAATTGGGRGDFYTRRWLLLATKPGGVCYEPIATVLQGGRRALQRCYERAAAMLQSGKTARARAVLLQSESHRAARRTASPWRCYHRPSAMLQVRDGGATIGRRRCYQRLAALLQVTIPASSLSTGGAAVRGRRCCQGQDGGATERLGGDANKERRIFYHELDLTSESAGMGDDATGGGNYATGAGGRSPRLPGDAARSLAMCFFFPACAGALTLTNGSD